MPTYEYECTKCGQRSEVVQKFTDAALTTCHECGGDLRKVYSAVGVVFKGSGFYKTDSRGTSSAASTSTSKTPEATPAATASATSTPAPSTTASDS